MTGPLAGLLVIDLSRALAGPHAGMMLGDLGARIIKVESRTGDDSRSWGPPYVAPDEGDRESTYFLSANRNKESIVLDLKHPDDVEVLRELIRRADVLLENFRPGVMARLGFDARALEALNPRLVSLSVSGFGHDGPEGGRPGYDQIAQGEAGLMSLTGSGPDDVHRVGVPIADLLAGLYGAYGVLAALHERERTGRGQVVRTSLLAAVVGAHALHGTAYTVAGQVGRASGNHHPSIAPYGLFRCNGGIVQLACGNESLWSRLCDAFALPRDLPGLSTNSERVANRERLVELLESTFSVLTPAEVLDRLDGAGVPAGKVRTIDEVYEWAQTGSQGLKITVNHTTLGEITLPGPPLRFFVADPLGEQETTPSQHAAPPLLGEHTESVKAWLAQGKPFVDQPPSTPTTDR